MTAAARPAGKGALIVRLRNWVGEVVLGLPTLVQLAEAGYELHLVGKFWAADLLTGHGWPVHVRPAGTRAAIAQLVALKRRLAAVEPSFTRRLNTLLFTTSLSSAMEAWLAGLRACGAAADGRSPLLAHAVRLQAGLHVDEGYWRVAAALGGAEIPPDVALLRTSAEHDTLAHALIDEHRLGTRYAVLCPFSGSGDVEGRRRWPGFAALAEWLRAKGIATVICNGGTAESTQARRDYPAAVIPAPMTLGAYAALMRSAWSTIANDTGPGHLAAAAGARLLSIYGPASFETTWMPPIGPRAVLLQNAARWPTLDEVVAHLPVQERL